MTSSPPLEADTADILNLNYLNVSKSGSQMGQIDPNPNGIGQPGSLNSSSGSDVFKSDVSENLLNNFFTI